MATVHRAVVSTLGRLKHQKSGSSPWESETQAQCVATHRAPDEQEIEQRPQRQCDPEPVKGSGDPGLIRSQAD